MSKPYGKWPSRKEAEDRAKEIRDNNRNRCLQGQGGALLADEGFTSRWQMFHAKHALLRLLTKEQHNKKTYALRSKDEERIKAIANDPELVVDPSHESVWKTVQKNLLKELSTPYLHIDSEGRLTVTSNRNKRSN